jgi:hypothetical protein
MMRILAHRNEMKSLFFMPSCLILLVSECFAFSSSQRRRLGIPSPGLSAAPRNENNGDQEDDEFRKWSIEEDLDFYRDFQEAKASKLGASLPPDQLRRAAMRAEGEFLQAMKETRDEFQQAKQDLGSDGAVNLFMKRIQKDDQQETSDDPNHVKRDFH